VTKNRTYFQANTETFSKCCKTFPRSFLFFQTC
jgi:hypothetical protein